MIIKQSEEGRQLIHDCLDFLNERVAIESLYSSKLKKLQSQFQNLQYDRGW